MASIFLNVIPGAALDFIGERLDEVGPAERIGGAGDAAFMRQDLLRAQREGRGKLGRKRPGLVQGIGMQGLRAAHHRGERLQSAVRTTLLYGCCAVSEQPAVCAWNRSAAGSRRLRAKSLGHRLVPDAARGAIFRDFFKEIVVRVEEERKPRRETRPRRGPAGRPIRRIRSRRAG